MRGLFWWRPPCWRRRVIVNLQHDPTEAFEGILWAYSWGGWLTLRDASALKAGQPPAKLPGGEIVVHRSNLAFTQVLL